MFATWIGFERAGGRPRTPRRVAQRVVVVGLWLAAAVAVPVLGNDKNQPSLTVFVTVACLAAFNQSRQDRRDR